MTKDNKQSVIMIKTFAQEQMKALIDYSLNCLESKECFNKYECSTQTEKDLLQVAIISNDITSGIVETQMSTLHGIIQGLNVLLESKEESS